MGQGQISPRPEPISRLSPASYHTMAISKAKTRSQQALGAPAFAFRGRPRPVRCIGGLCGRRDQQTAFMAPSATKRTATTAVARCHRQPAAEAHAKGYHANKAAKKMGQGQISPRPEPISRLSPAFYHTTAISKAKTRLRRPLGHRPPLFAAGPLHWRAMRHLPRCH